ncbi:hypothetical protein ACHAXR_007453 [Thalassiosira sp. AJA248-18]
MEHLLYADAMNCVLLKEAVMDFIVENRAEVLQNVSLKDVPGGLFGDLLTATMIRDSDEGGDEFSLLRNSDKKLHEKGRDIDESRDTM